MRLDIPLPPPEPASQSAPVFCRSFVLRLLLYGTILSAIHYLALWLPYGFDTEGMFKFFLFPWIYVRDPLVTHVVYSFVSAWNPNSYRYVRWFDYSGIVANSALWGFTIAFFLLPEKLRKKRDA